MANKHSIAFKSLAGRTRKASQGLSSQDEARAEQSYRGEQRDELTLLDVVSLEKIGQRYMGDSRPINPMHVVRIAVSIEAIGLIEPIVVDSEYRLLAGGHRLLALKLLEPDSRISALVSLSNMLNLRESRKFDDELIELPEVSEFNFREVPVRVFEFDSEKEPNRALEVELTENTQRRDYTPAEVFDLYVALLAKGYSEVRGRPKKGERAVKPALATLIGRSIRTVQRKLEVADKLRTDEEEIAEELKMILRLSKRLAESLESCSEDMLEGLRSQKGYRAVTRRIRHLLK